MKVKYIVLVGCLCLIGSSAFGQGTPEDAIRYSMTRQTPTARTAGMAGAFGALGGDLGALHTNPAGIAVFRSGAMAFSSSFGLLNSNSTYIGEEQLDSRPSFKIDNAGMVFVRDFKRNYNARGEEDSGLRNFNWGITYNRIANFNQRSSATGLNAEHSLADAFVERARGYSEQDLFFDAEDFGTYPPVDVAFDAALAYNAYLIDPNPNAPGNYVNPFRGLKRQSVVNRSRGGISDLGFTFGGNFSDKLFVGAGVGILLYNYENTRTFSETDAMDTIFDFQSFAFEERLNTSGAGVNLRFGVLLAPTDFLRFGASIQSPTYTALSETYETSISANFDNGDRESFVSPYTSEFDYSQDVPLKASASAAFLFGTQGLVSLEYEFQDMSQIVHRSDEQNFNFWAIEMNQEVQQLYTQVHSIRAGAELKSGPISYRAGYAHSTSPFENPDFTEGGDLSQNDISVGLGYRQGKFFMDAALAHSRMKSLNIPYSVTGGTEYGVLSANNRTRLMLTLGVRL